MVAKFLSPGVFTSEIDQSFLAQGVAGIGAGLVGAAEKGPAMVPTQLSNFDEFYARFGSLNTLMEGPYAARNYLKNNSVLNYVRVLGHNDGLSTVTAGYSVGGISGITDGPTGSVLAVVHHSGTSSEMTVTGVATDANNFIFTIGTFSTTASFVTSSVNYIGKVLNTDPTRYSTDNHYLYQVFKYQPVAASASWSTVGVSGTLTSFSKNFTSGSTPWVMSQNLGGSEFNLFKLHTLSHGKSTNSEIKVSIQNVKPSTNDTSTPYGSFDITVRKFWDSDQRPEVLETFTNLSLDPKDRNYVARRIGEKYEEFDTNERKFAAVGNFPSKSKYIRVEMLENTSAPAEAIPFGFRGYRKLTYNVSDINSNGVSHTLPVLKYQPNQVDINSNFNPAVYWGVMFVSGGVADRMKALPALTEAQYTDNTAADADFSLRHLSRSYEQGGPRYEYNPATTAYAPIYLSGSIQKFTLAFQGGFDGWDLRVKNPLDVANATGDTDLAVASLKRAVDTLADPDFIDLNLLALPGVHNLKVTDHARQMVNNRMDVMYIMDITGATPSEAVDALKSRDIDDNYTAAYYPDVKIDDDVNSTIVRVKPSTVVLGAFAYSDRVGQQWFAPAGLNRGGLEQFGVIDIVDRVNHVDRDLLQDNRINPLAKFPQEGITVWGQKTLQVAESALDRVNVRRLLIFAKKTIASAAKYLVFEPNNPRTYQRFTNTVNPILEDVRQKQGVDRFKVVMDGNLNTPDVVDRNIMVGKIFLQPTKSAEKIDLQFVITAAGVSFAS